MKINKLIFVLPLLACGQSKSVEAPERLPFYGEPAIVARVENGVTTTDTIYPVLPGFRMVNQNGDTVTEASGLGKVQIADFFFTSCPTICPVMTKQLSRVHEVYKRNPDVVIFSYTIDPDHDSVPVLREYAERVEGELPGWHFLRGSMDSTFILADAHGSYAREEVTSPGGFEHSGALVLIDRNRRVRGIYNGVDAKEVDQLIKDIERLLSE